METVTAAINAEVDNLIVTPKLLSRPLFNSDPRFAFIGKAFNQSQAFAFAYGNQLAPMVASRPGVGIANWMAQAVFFGAVSDALHNHISGRRSIGESAELWANPDKTAGMAYAAVNRAGLLGYLARPMAWADQAGVGVGPILGNDVSSMAAAQALAVTGKLGPFFNWAHDLGRGLGPLLTNTDQGYTPSLRHTLRKTLPFQNLLWTKALYTATRDAGFDNPGGPGNGLDVFLTRPAKEANQRQQKPRP